MDDEGVSAVIGVILMVAITVVLAAVIAAFTFNIGTTLPDNKNVVVEVHRLNATCIYVKTINGDDVRNLVFDAPGAVNAALGKSGGGFYGVYNFTVNGVEISNYVPDGTPNCTSQIGSMQYFSPVPSDSQITILGNFKDLSQAVIYSGTQ